MNKIYKILIICLISGIVFACSSDQEIRALYSSRPCPQTIIMNSNSECTQTEKPPILPVKSLIIEKKLAFEKQEADECPEYKPLKIFKWEIAVYFDYKKHDLSADALQKLHQNVLLLKAQPLSHLSIRGFTDNRGNHDYNQRLANQRALSVVNYLMQHDINKDRMILSPVGETAPLLPNNTEENMAVNRRVELLLLNSDGQPVPYIILTPQIETLFDQKITQNNFCKYWDERIQWFPGIFFTLTHTNLNTKEMKKLKRNMQVMKTHSDYMVSIREFSSSTQIKKHMTHQRVQFLEKFLYTNYIERYRVQVISPEETRVFQTFDSGHHSNDIPCVEMLLLDHKARPIPLIVVIENIN